MQPKPLCYIPQVACKDHYRLTEAGSEFPKCLKSGQFEKGKECEPIMCSAYKPPENGGVWPDTPVQAGTRVTIYCFQGYEEDYDDDMQGKLIDASPLGAMPKLRHLAMHGCRGEFPDFDAAAAVALKAKLLRGEVTAVCLCKVLVRRLDIRRAEREAARLVQCACCGPCECGECSDCE